MKTRRQFWADFFSGDNSRVNTMAVLAVALAAPFALLSLVALAYHIFLLKRGLDSPAVQLFSIMVGAATGGLGLSMFSRSLWGGSGPQIGNNLPRPRVPPKPPDA
jgi:hypothetical protein